MKIGELAKLAGVSKHTIRFYGQMGLIKSTPVTAGSREYGDYSKNSVTAVARVKRFQELGFSLAEIRQYVQDSEIRDFSTEELQTVLEPKLVELKERRKSLDELISFLEGKLSGRIRHK